MDGFRIVLFLVALVFIAINFFINSANLIKIISYCFATNSVKEYWSLFGKSCLSGRAIFSSIIAIVLAILIFIIITPIILIRGTFMKKREDQLLSTGAIFKYNDFKPNGDKEFYDTNADRMGISGVKVKITGEVKIDILMIISELQIVAKKAGIEISYQAAHRVETKDGDAVIVPFMLTVDETEYPCYLITSPQQVEQYRTVSPTLRSAGYNRCIYFSTHRV